MNTFARPRKEKDARLTLEALITGSMCRNDTTALSGWVPWYS